ncbi:MAG: hypothetical protein VX498_04710 [Myxococcota bacterium]|nr:hypothetical protein [Myxococcota bacterium]
MEPRFAAGLGKGFQLELAIPVDVKAATIEYTLPDGSSFEPPYGDTHHRTETLFGLGDLRLQVAGYRRVESTPLLLGARIGLALPSGKTEEDPFRAATDGEEHQHLQFGNGTVDPLVAVELLVQSKPVGLLGSFSGRFPLYENPKGYRGSIQLAGNLGPVFRPPKPLDKLQFIVLANATWMSAEYWNGEEGENSGLGTVGASVGAGWQISPKVLLSGMVNFRIREFAVGAQFQQPVTGTIGLSGFFDAPHPKHPGD